MVDERKPRISPRAVAGITCIVGAIAVAVAGVHGVPGLHRVDANKVLIAAVRSNDTAVALHALKSGANPNAVNGVETSSSGFHLQLASHAPERTLAERESDAIDAKEPALVIAAEHGNDALVDALLAAGAKVDLRNRDGRDLLMWAAEAGDAKRIDALLALHADPNAKDKQGWTPLMYAVGSRKVEAVRELLNHHAIVDQHNNLAETALVYACHLPNSQVVQTLLEEGAKANQINEVGWTPLMYASYYGYADTVRALLHAGADPLARAPDGSTATLWAHERSHPDIEAMLNQTGPHP